VLPTFNSHAIEGALYRIPDLSENYLYLNDDFLLMSRQAPGHYFDADAVASVFLSGSPVPSGPAMPTDTAFVAGAKNTRDLLAPDFTQPVDRLLVHAPYAQSKSVFAELWQRYPDVMAATQATRFRSTTNVSPVFLHAWYALLTGKAVARPTASRYVDLASPAAVKRLPTEVFRTDPDSLCINLAGTPASPISELAPMVSATLAARFPERCRFERA